MYIYKIQHKHCFTCLCIQHLATLANHLPKPGVAKFKVEPVASLIPRITGDLGANECVNTCVCVCAHAMPHSPLSIMGWAEDGCGSQMKACLGFCGPTSVGGLFSATRSFRGAGLEPQEQREEEVLLVPHAGWLLLEHAQPLREAFSNAAQPAQSQATAPRVLSHGESNALGLPSLPAAELGWHLGTRLLMVTNDVCGARVWPRIKMPLLQMGILPGLQGSNPKARFVSLWSITTCAAISQSPGRCHCQLLPQTGTYSSSHPPASHQENLRRS